MTKKNRKRRLKRWATSAGTRGINRVRAYEHVNGKLYLEWRVGGKTHCSRLETSDRLEATRAAHAKTAERLEPSECASSLTLSSLFDNYLADREVQGHRNYKQRVRCAALFCTMWGQDRAVSSLSMRDVEAYIRARSTGNLRPPKGHPDGVRARAIEEELQGLRAALNWATKTGDGDGAWLLQENPIRGFKMPREQNVRRPRLAEGEYERMLAHARQIDVRFWLLLVLAYETGHRLNSLRQLDWRDVNMEARTIHWRGEAQKNGLDHSTPMSPAAFTALVEYRASTGQVGGFLFANRTGLAPVGREQAYKWWNACRAAAGLEPKKGGAFHMFRREMASQLATAPLSMVKNLMGSKTPHVLVSAYQQPGTEQLRSLLENREAFATGASYTQFITNP